MEIDLDLGEYDSFLLIRGMIQMIIVIKIMHSARSDTEDEVLKFIDGIDFLVRAMSLLLGFELPFVLRVVVRQPHCGQVSVLHFVVAV